MIMLDKIKAFFKWYVEGWERLGLEHLGPKPKVKGAEKKAVEPPETKVAEAPEKKEDESSSVEKRVLSGKPGCWGFPP